MLLAALVLALASTGCASESNSCGRPKSKPFAGAGPVTVTLQLQSGQLGEQDLNGGFWSDFGGGTAWRGSSTAEATVSGNRMTLDDGQGHVVVLQRVFCE